MAQTPTHVTLQRTTKGFGLLSKAALDVTKNFAKTEKQSKSLGGAFGFLERHVGALTAGLLARGAWESGLRTMGELQELSLDAARALGEMNKQGEIMGEVFKGASELGISYQQMAGAFKSAARFHGQMQMTNEQFMAATKNAAAFGEATGMGAERGAEMMGELVGVARTTPKELRRIQDEFIHLQRAIGFTGEELSELAKGITPIIAQIKNLGATSHDVDQLTKAVGNMAGKFAAIGKSAGEAAQFMDRMLDPERFNENVVLMNRLGISADKALSAMMGGDTGDFLDQISDRLPDISKQIIAMGPMAGAAMAKQLGLQWRDLLKFQNMNSEEAKKRMDALDKERKNEEAFNEQLQQSIKTWQRFFISLSHQFDAIRMRFSSILGGQNFAKMQGMFIKFAHKIMDSLEKIDIAGWISKILDVASNSFDILMKLVDPAIKAFGWLVDKIKGLVEWSEKAFGKKGPLMLALGLFVGAKVPSMVGGVLNIMEKLRGTPMNPMFVTMAPGVGSLMGGGGGLGGAMGAIGKAAPWIAAAMAAYGAIKGAFLDDDNIRKAFGKSDKDIIEGKERFAAGLVGMIDSLTLGMVPDDIKTRMMKTMKERGVLKTLAEWTGPLTGVIVRATDAMFDESQVRKILNKTEKDAVTFADRIGAGMANALDMFGVIDPATKQKIAKTGSDIVAGIQRIAAAGMKGAKTGAMAGGAKGLTSLGAGGAVAGAAKGAGMGAMAGALSESFNLLIESTGAYQKALKAGATEQKAFQEGLFNHLMSASAASPISLSDAPRRIPPLNEIPPWWEANVVAPFLGFVDNVASFIESVPAQWEKYVVAPFLGLVDRIANFFEQGLSRMWDTFTTWIADIGTSIKDMFKGAVEDVKTAFMGWIKDATASMSDGINRLIYRILRGLENITGIGKFFKGGAADFAKTADAQMQKRFNDEVVALNQKAAAARTQGDVDIVNKMIDDLSARQAAQAQFLNQDKQAGEDGFHMLANTIQAHLKPIQEATKSTAGSGAQVARNTEVIADNTHKPKRFIDMNSLAIRANESRNVFFTYADSTGQG